MPSDKALSKAKETIEKLRYGKHGAVYVDSIQLSESRLLNSFASALEAWGEEVRANTIEECAEVVKNHTTIQGTTSLTREYERIYDEIRSLQEKKV